ncbi:hypothetical protein [Streptomyces sp. NPDC056244]|uniref:hypothetical protein n=1 Tax=Streptomyces sp. NPDC056244 TaxID=3345762 RepID=UPI0035E15C63
MEDQTRIHDTEEHFNTATSHNPVDIAQPFRKDRIRSGIFTGTPPSTKSEEFQMAIAKFRRSMQITMAAAAGALIVTLSAGPASAGTGSGWCQANSYTNCATLFYNSDFSGASLDVWNQNIPDFAPYSYSGGGAGSGQGVKNNAASALNRNSNSSATIWFFSGYSGPCDTMRPERGTDSRLRNTYNENASLSFTQGTNCYVW